MQSYARFRWDNSTAANPTAPLCPQAVPCCYCCACSRHLIICLPGLAFADACHAGRFARCVLLRLLHTAVHSSCYGQLLVRNKDGGLTTFVDMGVYTRNR